MKKSISARFLALALAAGLAGFSADANAQQATLTGSFTFTGTLLLTFDGTSLTSGDGSQPAWSIDARNSIYGIFMSFGATDLVDEWNTGSPLAYQSTIDSSGTYNAFWNHSISSSFSENYFGIRYDLGSGNYNYGWVGLSFDSASGIGTFLGAAINTTPNLAISAGVVPEPSSTCLLGLGIGALAFVIAGKRRAARFGG